jgi:hypothetical protein
MMPAKRRNPLMPWFIGLAVIVAADLIVAYRMFATACQASGLAQALVLGVMPAVYLVLMYLTLRSQD